MLEAALRAASYEVFLGQRHQEAPQEDAQAQAAQAAEAAATQAQAIV
jgi:hypothetical protein